MRYTIKGDKHKLGANHKQDSRVRQQDTEGKDENDRAIYRRKTK